MLIAVESYIFYGAMVLSFLFMIFGIGIFMVLRNNAPDAFMHWKAKKQGSPICRVHFRGRVTKDYIATVDKIEQELGTPYWKVPAIGLKFKPEADSIHFIEGNLPCCDYYENIPKSIKTEIAVAYSQLRDYFKKIGIPIDGIEDLAFYIASESTISDAETAIKDARINSDETKNILRKYIHTIKENEQKLKSLRLESGVFTWQTAMNALDSTIAYTSSSLTHTKETIRAAVMRQEENNKKQMMQYAIIAVILAIAGIILLYGIKGLS